MAANRNGLVVLMKIQNGTWTMCFPSPWNFPSLHGDMVPHEIYDILIQSHRIQCVRRVQLVLPLPGECLYKTSQSLHHSLNTATLWLASQLSGPTKPEHYAK